MAETPEQRDAFIRRVIDEADAEIRARYPVEEPEPHYLRPVQAGLFPVRWCPECRSAGVVGIEQDVCPTCDGTGKVAAAGVKASDGGDRG